jgi:hypothetical protein
VVEWGESKYVVEVGWVKYKTSPQMFRCLEAVGGKNITTNVPMFGGQ